MNKGMLSSRRNRGMQKIDDPWDDDGFYAYRRFRAKGTKAGKRPWRRAMRHREETQFNTALRKGEYDVSSYCDSSSFGEAQIL